MCGIYGMVALRRGEPLRFPERLAAMGESLRHRGPDGEGSLRRSHVAVGSRRLRIVDLHERADQPFRDPEAPHWAVCNGEIYNAAELRRRYSDYPFRSHSDVETLLPLYRHRGAEGIAELDGMFAVAIWDDEAHALILARDRAGEKPLFYSRVGGELWFASELQALLLHPEISRELDEVAIGHYAALGWVPAPRTTFREIRKVEPGTIARFTPENEKTIRYWDPAAFTTHPEPAAAPERLRGLLESAVDKQLTADVPIGVFVSGGIDSALLAELASKNGRAGSLFTYTARFSEPSYDESREAGSSVHHLGTEHREVVVDERSMGEALEAVSGQLAEPLADPALLPTWLLAREAQREVKVILSGEGADELFGGYPTYLGHKLAPLLLALPQPVRRAVRAGVARLPPSRRKVTLEFLLRRFLDGVEKPWPGRHLAWFGTGADRLLLDDRRPDGVFAELAQGTGTAADAMLLDYRSYLPDDLLVKVDRATMLHSVEARAPFLDREVSAFALALPERLRVRGLTTKWLLKRAARAWLPRRTTSRRKRGLSVPVASWLDRGLRPEVDRLLEPGRLARQELFDPRRVHRTLGEHRAGKANHARPLWTVVVLQYWLERWAPERAR